MLSQGRQENGRTRTHGHLVCALRAGARQQAAQIDKLRWRCESGTVWKSPKRAVGKLPLLKCLLASCGALVHTQDLRNAGRSRLIFHSSGGSAYACHSIFEAITRTPSECFMDALTTRPTKLTCCAVVR